MTRHALKTFCKHGLLVDSLKTTLHYNFPLMAHNYIKTEPLTAGSRSFTIFPLDYITKRLLLSLAALFLINQRKWTHFYFYHSIMLLPYNARASSTLTCQHLLLFHAPFPLLWLHQLMDQVQHPCLDLLGIVGNKGADFIARSLDGNKTRMDITSQWCPNLTCTTFWAAVTVMSYSRIYANFDRILAWPTNKTYSSCFQHGSLPSTTGITCRLVFASPHSFLDLQYLIFPIYLQWISCIFQFWMILISFWDCREAQSSIIHSTMSPSRTGLFSRTNNGGRLMVRLLRQPFYLFPHCLDACLAIQLRRSTLSTKLGSFSYISIVLGLFCFDTSFHSSTGSTTANWLLEFKYFGVPLLLHRDSEMATKSSRILSRILRHFTINGRNHAFILFVTAYTYSLTSLQRQFELVHLPVMHSGEWRPLLAISAEKFIKTKTFSKILKNMECFKPKSTLSWQCIQNLRSIIVCKGCISVHMPFQMVMHFYHNVTIQQEWWQILNTMDWWHTGNRLDGPIGYPGPTELFVGGTWHYVLR